MRILIISQYYPPENTLIAPTLARELVSKGHQVRVLTGFPNYPEGRLFAGYRQKWRDRELDGGVEVLRVPLLVDHSQSAPRRAANYSSFALSATTAYGFARAADVIYVYATQMTAALAPWLWRLIDRTPYVLHIQDLWPDSITGSSMVRGIWRAGFVNALLTPWISSVYRNAAAVIGIAPTMVETLIGRGVDPARVHLLYNWAEEASLMPPESPSDALSSSATGARVLYGGNVGDLQDLETVVQAADRARDAGIQLSVVGDGVALPRIRALVERLGSTNIEFKNRVAREQMGSLYRAADYALVTLKDLPVFRGTVPSKLQAALSHGVPVISTVQGDVRALVEELRVGFTADAEDVDSLEIAFRAAAACDREERINMSRRARDAYVSRFSLTAGIAAIEGILRDAAQSRSHGIRERRVEWELP